MPQRNSRLFNVPAGPAPTPQAVHCLPATLNKPLLIDNPRLYRTTRSRVEQTRVQGASAAQAPAASNKQ
jgi:hypothetical protein